MRHDQKSELTPPEKECLRAYRLARREIGMNPTAAEVGQRMESGGSRYNAALLMKRLAEKGKLERRVDTGSRCYWPIARRAEAAA